MRAWRAGGGATHVVAGQHGLLAAEARRAAAQQRAQQARHGAAARAAGSRRQRMVHGREQLAVGDGALLALDGLDERVRGRARGHPSACA